jgi:hypothetical protein
VRDTWQHVVNTGVYSWETTVFGHDNPRLRYPCGQVVFYINIGTFSLSASLRLGWRPWASPSTKPECSLNVH